MNPIAALHVSSGKSSRQENKRAPDSAIRKYNKSLKVTQRVHEIGVRMALGAEKRRILLMVVGHGLRLAVIGLAIGAAAALILARLLSSFSHLLYGVGASDPATFNCV